MMLVPFPFLVGPTLSPFFSGAERAIDEGLAQVQLVAVLDQFMEGSEDGGKGMLIVPPFITVVAGGLSGVVAPGEGIPLGIRSKHPEHSVEHIVVRETWAASLGALDGLGQERRVGALLDELESVFQRVALKLTHRSGQNNRIYLRKSHLKDVTQHQ